MSMWQRSMAWFRMVSDLGRLWLKSREPHVEANLPADLGDGLWVAIATKTPTQPGEPVYGTVAYKPVLAGQRFWIFVDEGEYWIYGVPGDELQPALRDFYADPDAAVFIDSRVQSLPGFRTDLSEQ